MRHWTIVAAFAVGLGASRDVGAQVDDVLRAAPLGAPHRAELDLIANFRYPPRPDDLATFRASVTEAARTLCDATE